MDSRRHRACARRGSSCQIPLQRSEVDSEPKLVGPEMRHLEPDSWLRFFRRYFLAIAILNLCWEAAQLPLYTIWVDGSTGRRLFAVLHCTAGDLLISVASLVVALILAGNGWPVRRSAYWRGATTAARLGAASA